MNIETYILGYLSSVGIANFIWYNKIKKDIDKEIKFTEEADVLVLSVFKPVIIPPSYVNIKHVAVPVNSNQYSEREKTILDLIRINGHNHYNLSDLTIDKNDILLH
jgi:hypothetical protein